MRSQKLYIITGLPYSGKTTLRKELVKRFGFSVVSIDDLNTVNDIGVPETQEEWNKVYSQLYDTLKQYLGEGKSVIFDGGCLEFKNRETERQIAEAFNVPSILIYVKESIEEIKKRRAENETTKVRGHVKDEHFEMALSHWEEPTAKENPIIYSQNMNIDKWINENF